MKLNFPVYLTVLRILLIPVFVLVFYLPFSWTNLATTSIFALAALTDWLDGHLARRFNQTTAFGAFLDPVADKLFVGVVLVLLVQIHPTPWLAIPAAVIIGREITISALREWMAELGKRAKVAVSMAGKVKTAMQMTALLFLLYEKPLWGLPMYKIGLVCLFVAALLTLWSMVIYLQAALPLLVEDDSQNHPG